MMTPKEHLFLRHLRSLLGIAEIVQDEYDNSAELADWFDKADGSAPLLGVYLTDFIEKLDNVVDDLEST